MKSWPERPLEVHLVQASQAGSRHSRKSTASHSISKVKFGIAGTPGRSPRRTSCVRILLARPTRHGWIAAIIVACRKRHLDEDALDLIQTDGIVGAVIQLGGARRLVGRNLLGAFNCTAILQISGDPGSLESMAAGCLGQSDLSSAPCWRCWPVCSRVPGRCDLRRRAAGARSRCKRHCVVCRGGA